VSEGRRRGAGKAGEGGNAPGGPGSPVDRADYDPAYDPEAPVLCEVCGGEMYYTAACKLKCPRCGYMRDCSDP
jgi:hypothetical protein